MLSFNAFSNKVIDYPVIGCQHPINIPQFFTLKTTLAQIRRDKPADPVASPVVQTPESSIPLRCIS
jgi:hypothetical protein